MCGIVGYVGPLNAVNVIMNGLENLEYRGYDSAGIAVKILSPHEEMHSLVVEKAVGKLSSLKDVLKKKPLFSHLGMGHTRWATHGVPSLTNAHPHRYGRVAVIHNGIFENHKIIRNKLMDKGHTFYSDTDTEVAAHLLDELLTEHSDPIFAINVLADTVRGTYAIGIMFDFDHQRIYFAKHGSPLVVAENDEEAFFASDQAALVDYQPRYYSLNDGEMGFIAKDGVQVFDIRGKRSLLSWSRLHEKKEEVQKIGHKHFMHKEIFEQPETIDRVLQGRLTPEGFDLGGFDINFDQINLAQKIQIIGCGSAYYAGLIAKNFLETRLKLPISVEIASEYRYRETLTDSKTLVIAISQSGETVDTLEALKKAKSLNAMCVSICNVVGSALAYACEISVGNFFLNAGKEISVASTKAFIAQVVALKLLAMAMLKKKGQLLIDEERNLSAYFNTLKEEISQILARDHEIRALAKDLVQQERMFYIGRGELFPVALEGALKMKELSYIFAEGYPAGELKHGPIAVIDKGMPVVVLFGSDGLSTKTASNLQEVKARGAKIIGIMPKSLASIKEDCDLYFEMGACEPMFEPILLTIPLQLLAYHVSDLKGIDVDKPRNLAKSVTVE